MKVTTRLLQEKQACSSWIEKFIQYFPSGEAEYQDVLDKLAELNDAINAKWLLKTIGKTDAVLEIDGNIERTNIFFAGAIKATGSIKVGLFLLAGGGIEAGGGIKAGWGINAGGGIEADGGIKARCDIEAGWDIKAGWSIEAGWGIKAGGGIKAGDCIKAGGAFGVFAGLGIRLDRWRIDAKVSAKTKPENLVSGFWVESSEVSE